ncbi:TPA: hypothetical protein PXM37_004272 [Yersinia enterocolitica]|nr:hypothetical protein [Yersinia enterocolitica]HDL6985318.1 hypothetical protein [Yersinia enterocolitica]HDL7067858.1 hypothetical protein [Yersinia enterocolitica]HDL7072249.1 hypothetical protein [Yersinia enterocolitica]
MAALKDFVLDMAAYGAPVNDFTSFMQLENERVGEGNVNADEFLMCTVKTGVYLLRVIDLRKSGMIRMDY